MGSFRRGDDTIIWKSHNEILPSEHEREYVILMNYQQLRLTV